MPMENGIAALRLWKTASSASDFRDAIDAHYQACIVAMERAGKKELVELDNFWRKTFPATLQRRQSENKGNDCWITKEELVQTMQWKLARGKMRPLMNLVRGNDSGTVERISRSALIAAQKGDISNAVTILSGAELKGVGPATASALLAAYRPDLFPFMADEPTMLVLDESGQNGKLKYNLAEYLVFQRAIIGKCREINVPGEKAKSGTERPLDAEEVGRALWCLNRAEALGELQRMQSFSFPAWGLSS